jgi:hypothetical protein
LPALVSHERIERLHRGEPQELDLQRLPACAAAPSPLEHPATVPSSDAQDPVLVGDQVILGPWPRPQQDAQSQTHSADLRDSDFCIPAECLTGNEPAAIAWGD